MAFASPEPLTIAEAQAQLRTDEALVLFLDTRELRSELEETFTWVITKTEVRWVRTGWAPRRSRSGSRHCAAGSTPRSGMAVGLRTNASRR